jgi:protein-tyrosine phosphatase
MHSTRAFDTRTVVNLRDLGGIELDRGRRVVPGVLWRSGRPGAFGATHDPALTALGIRTVVDLRTAEERAAAPVRVPPGTRVLVADVLGADPVVSAARLQTLLSDMSLAVRELGEAKANQLFAHAYRAMVCSPGSTSAYRALVETAADPRSRPLLFHCTAGKDRTGWGATLLLLLLGASRDTVRREFQAVEQKVRTSSAHLAGDLVTTAGDRPTGITVTRTCAVSHLEVALDAMDERWGGLAGYVRDGLRVPEATLARLREELTEPFPS